jgi:CTP synthase
MLLCRADREIPENERRKLSLFCNVRPSSVIQALDVKTIYDVPMAYHKEGLDDEVLAAFGIAPAPRRDMPGKRSSAASTIRKARSPSPSSASTPARTPTNPDRGAGAWRHRQPGQGQYRVDRVGGLRAEIRSPYLEGVHGILVPGGFGERGAEGKIAAVTFARERKVPYFGICFGMQMAVRRAARNIWPALRTPIRRNSARRRSRLSA